MKGRLCLNTNYITPRPPRAYFVVPHLMSYSGFLLWRCCINMFPCLSDESRDCSGRRGGVFYISASRKKTDCCDMAPTKYGPRPLHNVSDSDGDPPRPRPTRRGGARLVDMLNQLSCPHTGAACLRCPHRLLTKSALLLSESLLRRPLITPKKQM